MATFSLPNAPLPTKEDFDNLFKIFREQTIGIIEKLNQFQCRDEIDGCLGKMLSRLVNSLESMRVLYASAKHEFKYDCASILRGMYDLHLQSLYLLTDPAALGADFVDFVKVEKNMLLRIIERTPGTYAALSLSPEFRPAAERTLRDFEAVKHRFVTNSGKGVRSHWYKGTLSELAKAVGYETECKNVQHVLSGAVHSSPTLLGGLMSFMPPDGYVVDGWIITQRVAGAIAAYWGIALSSNEQAIVAAANKPLHA